MSIEHVRVLDVGDDGVQWHLFAIGAGVCVVAEAHVVHERRGRRQSRQLADEAQRHEDRLYALVDE